MHLSSFRSRPGGERSPAPLLRLGLLLAILFSVGCSDAEAEVTAISAGSGVSCALKSDGTAWCWGYNQTGSLGDGSTTPRGFPGPVTMPDATRFTEIGVGEFHVCALDTDGTPWCWGRNRQRQLGDGTREDRAVPARAGLPPGMTFSAISVGGYHTCGLATDRSVWCWGYNASAQAGAGRERLTSLAKVPLPTSLAVVEIAAGGYHTCALAADGATWCWGSNSWGQLGDGAPGQYRRRPYVRVRPVEVNMPQGVRFSHITAYGGGGGNEHTCALTSEGAAWCWGFPSTLGDGTDYNTQGGGPSWPVEVAMPPQVVFASIDAGGSHTCALTAAGSAWCWGYVTNGALGNVGRTDGASPVEVRQPDGIAFTAIDAGGSHTCALAADASVWCWGNNYFGQLGDGTVTGRAMPIRVEAL